MGTDNEFITCPYCLTSNYWESYLAEAWSGCPECEKFWNGTYKDIVINNSYQNILPLMNKESVDMVLCDLPYNTTSIDWDDEIDLKELWELYKPIMKPKGVIVLTASQPFTSKLVLSNPDEFKYELIWEKSNATGHMLAKHRPMKAHESILVFYQAQPTYNPQMDTGRPYKWNSKRTDSEHFDNKKNDLIDNKGLRYPRSVLKFKQERGLHPTQKPVSLFSWLIKTYTNKGDLVLDNCAGSGTTGVACIQTGRKYCLIEKEKKYYDVIMERLINVKQSIL